MCQCQIYQISYGLNSSPGIAHEGLRSSIANGATLYLHIGDAKYEKLPPWNETEMSRGIRGGPTTKGPGNSRWRVDMNHGPMVFTSFQDLATIFYPSHGAYEQQWSNLRYGKKEWPWNVKKWSLATSLNLRAIQQAASFSVQCDVLICQERGQFHFWWLLYLPF